MYRPPDATADASIRDFEDMFQNIEIPANVDLICIGDFNIDDAKLNADKRKLHLFMKNHNMGQEINQPTRLTPTTATIIDHIWCNNQAQYAHRGVLDTGLSDHSLVFLSIKKVKPSKEKECIFIRDYHFFDAKNFADDVLNADWSEVYAASTLDEAVACFNFVVSQIINRHLSWKSIRTHINTTPWVTSEFLSAIDTREYWARKCRKNRCQANFDQKKTAQR